MRPRLVLVLTSICLISAGRARGNPVEVAKEKRVAKIDMWRLTLPKDVKPEMYQAAIREREKFFSGCRKSNESALQVKATFEIATDGTVQRAAVKAGPSRDDRAETCMEDLIRKTGFPPGTRSVSAQLQLSLPFRGRAEPEPQLSRQPLAEVAPPIFENMNADAGLAFIRSNDGKFRECYRRGREAAGNGDIGAGVIQVKVKVDSRSLKKVTNAELVSSTLRNAVVENCVLQELKEAAVPAPSSGVEGFFVFSLLFP